MICKTTVARKPGHREEHETIAQGRPDVSAYTCGPTPVHSYRTGGHGCGGHPVFPAPSVFGGTDIRQTSGASRRENAACCLGVLSYQLFDNLPPAPPVRNLMDRVRCPNRDNRASYRPDSLAGTAGRCG